MNNKTLLVICLFFLGLMLWQSVMLYKLHTKMDQVTEVNDLPFLSEPPLTGNSDDSFANNNWHPFHEFTQLHNQMETLFSNSFSKLQQKLPQNAFNKIPSLNLEDTGDRYIVTIDMPGADPSTLNTELKDGQLTVTMKTEKTLDDSEQNFQRQERFSGIYQRSLTLSEPVKVDAMTTEYKNGVLTIVIPKA